MFFVFFKFHLRSGQTKEYKICISCIKELKLRLDIQLQTIASGGEHYGKTPAICIGQVKRKNHYYLNNYSCSTNILFVSKKNKVRKYDSKNWLRLHMADTGEPWF